MPGEALKSVLGKVTMAAIPRFAEDLFGSSPQVSGRVKFPVTRTLFGPELIETSTSSPFPS